VRDSHDERPSSTDTAASSGVPHSVRLPGFLIERDIGLGDLIKKTTYAMGISPCGGCERRAQALNRWMTLSR
jgi:hypothetical protein